MKFFDKLFINGMVIALLSLIFYFVTKVYIAGLFLGYLVWVVCRTLWLYFAGRYQVKKNVSAREMENIFAVWGTQKQAELFFNLLPTHYEPTLSGNKIVFRRDGKETALYLNYKFSPTSCEDIAKIYREEAVLPQKIYVLGKMPAKDVLLLSNTLSLPIEFPSPKSVRKYLIKHNAMPEKFPVKKTSRISLSLAFSSTFAPEKAKYYFFSSFFLSFYAILNIQRVWYISFAALMVCLGSGCIIASISEKTKHKSK